jgi:hypothetical protein
LKNHTRQHQAMREKMPEKWAEERTQRQETLKERWSAIREKAQQIYL